MCRKKKIINLNKIAVAQTNNHADIVKEKMKRTPPSPAPPQKRKKKILLVQDN